MKTVKESRALTEVWEWKDAAYREVENLDIETAMKKRLSTSVKTAKKLGFVLTSPADKLTRAS